MIVASLLSCLVGFYRPIDRIIGNACTRSRIHLSDKVDGTSDYFIATFDILSTAMCVLPRMYLRSMEVYSPQSYRDFLGKKYRKSC